MPEFWCRWLFWKDGTVNCVELEVSGISLRPLELFAAAALGTGADRPFWPARPPICTEEETNSALEFPVAARLCWWFCRIIRIWKYKMTMHNALKNSHGPKRNNLLKIWYYVRIVSLKTSRKIQMSEAMNLTLSVAVLKCSISVKNVLEADVRDSLLILAPLGGTPLVLGSRPQHKICWWTFENYNCFKEHFNWCRSYYLDKSLLVLPVFKGVDERIYHCRGPS